MTRHAKWSVLIALTATAIFATQGHAQTTRPAAHTPHFKPILSQQVVSNDSGGTRGAAFPWCEILAPTQMIAMTTSTQPTLCWWVEKKLPYAYQCTIIDTTTQDAITDSPILIPAVTAPGWQTIDLAKAGVTLKTDRKYQWNFSVAVGATDGIGNADPSTDAKPDVEPHSTLIQVVPVPPELAAASPEDRVQVMADHGLWLDVAADAVKADADHSSADTTAVLKQLVETFNRRKLLDKLKPTGK